MSKCSTFILVVGGILLLRCLFPLTRAATADNDSVWWSFKRLTKPALPPLSSPWVKSPIDAFVIAKLREKGLRPAPEADRRTLIRRLYYDLHGLPPGDAVTEAFVNDPDPMAYEKLVDRLLASPRYGERWARHWLDVVHYGDTHGFDKDKRRPNAWPYRDYVIESLNQDVPYWRFIQEQVAGDILFYGDPEGVVATGFIVAGPWDFVGHVELREGTTDKKITRVLDRDDMVANTMSTFNSLTVHCARCHDHKFDPISLEDYYGLQAVFAGVERADRPYYPEPRMHRSWLAWLDERDQLESERAKLKSEMAALSSPRLRELRAQQDRALEEATARLQEASTVRSPTLGYHSQTARTRYHEKWISIDLGKEVPIDQVILMPVHEKYKGQPGSGFGFPRRFRVEASRSSTFDEAYLLADETGADFPNPGDLPYAVDGNGSNARYVKVTATRLWPRHPDADKDWIFALSELLVISGGENVALDRPVTALDSLENDRWNKAALTDGATSLKVFHAPSPGYGFRSADAAFKNASKWVQFDFSKPRTITHVTLVAARNPEAPWENGFGFPSSIAIEISDSAGFQDSQTVWKSGPEEEVLPDGSGCFHVPLQSVTTRHLRIRATALKEEGANHLFALSEVQLLNGTTNVAAEANLTASDSRESGNWSLQHVVDHHDSLRALPVFSPAPGWRSAVSESIDATENAWVRLDLERDKPLQEIILYPASAYSQPTYGLPEILEINLRPEEAKDGSGSTWSVQPDSPVPIRIDAAGASGRFLTVQAKRLKKDADGKYRFALSEVEVMSAGANLAGEAVLEAGSSDDRRDWTLEAVRDGFDSIRRIHDEKVQKSFRFAEGTNEKAVLLDLGEPLAAEGLSIIATEMLDPAAWKNFQVTTSTAEDFEPGNVLFDGSTVEPRISESGNELNLALNSEILRWVRISWSSDTVSPPDLSEIVVYRGVENVARYRHVESSSSHEQGDWGKRYLVDGMISGGVHGNGWIQGIWFDALRDLAEDWKKAGASLQTAELALIGAEKKEAWRQSLHRLEEVEGSLAGLPEPEYVYAAAREFEGMGNFQPPGGPRPIHVLNRGDVTQPGPVAEPAAVNCLQGLEGELRLANLEDEGQRRAALAQWLSDRKNPLTWRSIVNRVWQYHFGRALVDTPNDFGRMGAEPTHPELLDWLAVTFRDGDQSLKSLHKMILNSSTWKQAVVSRPEFASVDASNRWLWRMNRWRLDAESLRDSILLLSGSLDSEIGGPGFDRFKFEDDHSPRYLYGEHDVGDPESWRRTVYRFTVRSVPDPFLTRLDCADPSQSVPVRNATMTPIQSLTLMNNAFMVEQAKRFSENIARLAEEPEKQMRLAWMRATGRQPDVKELDWLLAYGDRHGLASLCRVIFNANEFMFVE